MEREEMKQEAVRIMKELDIYKPYINAFKTKKRDVCFFENFGGYYAYQEPKLQKKIEELENKYGFMVYAVTHEFTEFGELYSFLYVSKHKDNWDYNIEKSGFRDFVVMAYVWNVDDEMCSEFGSILVTSFGGGIKRIG